VTIWTVPVPQHNRALATMDGCDPRQMTVVDYSRQVSAFIGEQLVSASVELSMTQASTLSLGFDDPRRELLDNPLLSQAVTIDNGLGRRFKLVKVSKSKNTLTATYEDAAIARLRTFTGPYAATAAWTRIQFAAQLGNQAGIDVITPAVQSVEAALVPLARGSSDAPGEDSWTCMTRIAGDVKYECFSNGQGIVFGPDDWLLHGAPAAQITELAAGVDYVDWDIDVGKPVQTVTVYSYASQWDAGVGEHVRLNNAGVASGDYLVQSVSRDLFHTPVTVKLVAEVPHIAEPKPDASGVT
jgi:hypothetical protein